MGTIALRDRAAGLISIGQAARELGLSVRQLRFRLEIGLLPPPVRLKSDGTRLFDRVWLGEARQRLATLQERDRG